MDLDDETLELLQGSGGSNFDSMVGSERLSLLLQLQKAAQYRYRHSDLGKARDQRYNATEERRLAHIDQERRYQKTEKGKAALKKAHAKYAKSAKGIAARKRAQAAYRKRLKEKKR